MRGRSILLASILLGCSPAVRALHQTPDPSAVQPPAAAQPTAPATPHMPMVRLRHVQGPVSILHGTKVEFPQAKANMPVLSGSTIATGEGGRAEIEFSDGSVARLTPQTRLLLVRLPLGDARSGQADSDATNPVQRSADPTNLELLSGLAYFELNTSGARPYSVRFGRGLVQPDESSIFRIDLDDTPELAVFLGAVQARADGGFDQPVEQGESLLLVRKRNVAGQLSQNIREDSWDRWNQDRDDQIATEAQHQTAASEQSSAAGEPGWNELDEYGNWYPTEQYGNVWTPANMPADWDPYSSGYWANYPGWGYTWISAYPWGWLPYQCGAWNYWNSFGWGWIPGQCGFGGQPIVTVWNAPPSFHAPARPLPGGHTGTPTLLAVHRGPAAPANGLLSNNHTRPVRIDGQRLDPLPIIEQPSSGTGNTFHQSGRVGVPMPFGGVGHGSMPQQGTGVRSVAPGSAPGGSSVSVWPRGAGVRPMNSGNYSSGKSGLRSEPPAVAPPVPPARVGGPVVSAPRIAPLSPGISAPRVTAPPPSAPHPSAPAASAPHANSGNTGSSVGATSAGHPH